MHFQQVHLQRKVFIYSAKSVRFQRQKCLSPAQNVLTCSVISYSEVSSRDHFIASDKHVCLLFGSRVRNPLPQKEQNVVKEVSAKLQVGMDVKKVQKQGRDKRMQEDYPASAVYFFSGASLLEMNFSRNFFLSVKLSHMHIALY